MFKNYELDYLTQYKAIKEGSTIMDGYVSLPTEENKGTTLKALLDNVKGGSYIAGYQILSATITYDGQDYTSEKKDDEEGVKGWIIAVAVVGGIIGLIIIIVIISCAVKKCKQNKADGSSENENAGSSTGKDT